MYNKLVKLVPARVRATKDITYEVVYTDNFKDVKQVGECHPDKQQITIKNGLSDTETISTFIHECLHMAALEYDVNLTEKQVLGLEAAAMKILKLNGVFKWILKK